MKKVTAFICSLFFFGAVANAQTTAKNAAVYPPSARIQVVEASCGQCKFGMKTKGCVLAVRIDGKAYLVEGAKDLDSYGDAHDEHGMCNAIRKAEVTGEIKNDKFIATSFKLLPVEKPKE